MSNRNTKPQDIYDIAKKLYHKRVSTIEEFQEEDRFLVTNTWDSIVTIGVRQDDLYDDENLFGIIRMVKSKETIGRHDHKLQEKENIYVKVNLYHYNLEEYNKEMSSKEIRDLLNDKEYEKSLNKGYIGGHMVTDLKDMIEEEFTSVRKGDIDRNNYNPE